MITNKFLNNKKATRKSLVFTTALCLSMGALTWNHAFAMEVQDDTNLEGITLRQQPSLPQPNNEEVQDNSLSPSSASIEKGQPFSSSSITPSNDKDEDSKNTLKAETSSTRETILPGEETPEDDKTKRENRELEKGIELSDKLYALKYAKAEREKIAFEKGIELSDKLYVLEVAKGEREKIVFEESLKESRILREKEIQAIDAKIECKNIKSAESIRVMKEESNAKAERENIKLEENRKRSKERQARLLKEIEDRSTREIAIDTKMNEILNKKLKTINDSENIESNENTSQSKKEELLKNTAVLFSMYTAAQQQVLNKEEQEKRNMSLLQRLIEGCCTPSLSPQLEELYTEKARLYRLYREAMHKVETDLCENKTQGGQANKPSDNGKEHMKNTNSMQTKNTQLPKECIEQMKISEGFIKRSQVNNSSDNGKQKMKTTDSISTNRHKSLNVNNKK